MKKNLKITLMCVYVCMYIHSKQNLLVEIAKVTSFFSKHTQYTETTVKIAIKIFINQHTHLHTLREFFFQVSPGFTPPPIAFYIKSVNVHCCYTASVSAFPFCNIITSLDVFKNCALNNNHRMSLPILTMNFA